ncbi:MAG: hypothetical protein QOH39_1700 [Verrucomicrobiota bacterium]
MFLIDQMRETTSADGSPPSSRSRGTAARQGRAVPTWMHEHEHEQEHEQE